MLNYQVQNGVYPTMVTPYQNGKIDYNAVEKLVEWYWKKGCDGIFAACQSSEILYLSLEERVQLTRTVVRCAKHLAETDKSRKPLTIVASGHISDSFEDQVRELNAIAAEQPDVLVLITNRMDIQNTSDEKWIAYAERLIAHLPQDIPLGLYECPLPYKRLLTEKMIKWCAQNDRFCFVKDTCCDAALIRQRLAWCKGSALKLFNANAQTLLESAKDGCNGYCGVMANFHPELYHCLFHAETLNCKETSLLQDFLGLAATIENMTYPCCAKYYLNKYENIPMETYARSAEKRNLTDYQKGCVDQLAELAEYVKEHIKKDHMAN